MSYADLPAKSSGDVFGLSEYNQIRDNFDAGMPDIISAKGDLGVGTGPDAIARLAVGAANAMLVPDSSTATGLRWQIVPLVKVFRSTAHTPATSSWQLVPWADEAFDTDAMHSIVTNTTRLTCVANADGVYRVEANIGFNTTVATPGESGHHGIRIRKNGSSTVVTTFDEAEMQSHDRWQNVSSLVQLSQGDYVELQVWTSQSVDVMAESWFSAQFVRAL